MAKPIVVLDLETTGLDPARDAIIEIGAIRFKGDRTEAEFNTLINPGRKLTPFITQLTGITDAMLVNAPRISEVLPRLEEFVGEAPVLGHNVKFDLGFLRAKQALRHNEGLDTWDLSSVLLPTASRYNLGSLAKELGIVLPASHQHHRALDDCKETLGVYRALFQKALELPLDVLAEIVKLGEDIEWGAGLVFAEALQARSREKSGPRRATAGPLGPLFGSVPALQPNDERMPLDIDELAALLEHSGPFSKHFPNYEFRAEQVQMLRAVAGAISESKHLMVEAGTGTGKSVAYLIPAAQWALQNGQRVVISTNTVNLQDQLVNKDIPDLQAALGLNFNACVLKGRSHYLCPRRLENMRRYGPKSAAELRVLAKVLVWLQSASEYGQLDEISLSGPEERVAWLRLSAEDEGCTGETCQARMRGTCPFFRAHKAAEAAHIIIVNHALLLADIASENRVLPEYQYLIVDEAHHLEAATTDGLSFHLGRLDLERRLKELGGPAAGLLGQLHTNTRDSLPPDAYALVEREVEYAYDRATAALELARAFFQAIEDFLEERRDGQPVGEFAQQVRIQPATRTSAEWEQVEISWEELSQALTSLTDSMKRLARGLTEFEEYDIPEREDLASAAGAAARHLDEIIENVTGLVFKPDAMMIYWAETYSDRVSLHAAPIHVGPLVEKHLWHAKEAVIMTSATLTTAGEFDYMKSRLNAAEAEELAVGSPFDYESSTLLYLVNDIPEPFDKMGYQKGIETGLINLCKATHGRALVLFTSYAQLKQTSQAIREPLARAGIEVYDQADGTSRTALLDSFKSSEGGVLLGTKSFWEGVDVPGEALSALVIVKLPFDVPSDPIIAARSETYERPFDEYSVPEAVLKFRQGFGRLIRSKSDRGVVVVFDRRVVSKGYGHIFLDSLPACTKKAAPLAQLAREAAKWIDGGSG
jgi:ATP-dependent DNA helicase DinG